MLFKRGDKVKYERVSLSSVLESYGRNYPHEIAAITEFLQGTLVVENTHDIGCACCRTAYFTVPENLRGLFGPQYTINFIYLKLAERPKQAPCGGCAWRHCKKHAAF